jgi:transposase
MTEQNTPLFIGGDVAQDAVVVAAHGQTTSRSIGNTPAALKAWLRTLPREARIGLESTGNHHERLALLAHRAGFTVYLLNPKDVRHYAHAVGKRAKTDHVDALLLARFIAHEHAGLHPWQPPTREQRHLDNLLKRRATLVKAHGMLRQTLAHLSPLKTESKAMLASLTKLIAAIDRKLEQAVAANPGVQAKADCVQSVPGIGLLTGTALVNLFSRLPSARADALVAFTGLDPRPCDSGKKRGARRLSKRGPGELRRLLFNAAMSAAKTRFWKPFYERERAKGLPTTAALVCLARRLVRVAFALYRNNVHFNPEAIHCA